MERDWTALLPDERARATQDWEPAACDQTCPCGGPNCEHGAVCPAAEDEDDPCAGHMVHTMRNPTTPDDVTRWMDDYCCCDGCTSYVVTFELAERPWGTVRDDGEVEVFRGVDHAELGV